MIKTTRESNEEGRECGRGTPASKQDKVWSFFFIFLWLIPLSYVGLTENWMPIAPRYFNDLYRVSELFSERVRYWSEYYIQVQLQGTGPEKWIHTADKNYSQILPFGYQNRLYFILRHSRIRSEDRPETLRWKRKLHAEFAQFIKQRFEELNPDKPSVAAVRLGEVRFPVGGRIAKPAGHWQKPYLVQVPINQRNLLFQYTFREAAEEVN